ncbi:MAG TPA: hypothetical protein VE690_23795 [Rhodopila sp.]|jgi:hypothetical protein|nr:hypothetical protein [Rhodopila sp.]
MQAEEELRLSAVTIMVIVGALILAAAIWVGCAGGLHRPPLEAAGPPPRLDTGAVDEEAWHGPLLNVAVHHVDQPRPLRSTTRIAL